MPLSAFVVAILCALLLGVPTGIAARSTPAAAATITAAVTATDSAAEVTLDVTPTGSPYLSPGENLDVTVSVTNGSDEPLAAGTVNLYLADRALISQASVSDWLASTNPGGPGDLLVATPLRSSVLPGDSTTVSITVPATSLGLTSGNAWGARGIAATLDVAGTVAAQGRGTFVWLTGDRTPPVNLALAMPITTPAGSSGLIPAVSLEAYTAPDGLLTRQLEGVVDRPVAIAIDPMIIASIRVLGNAAPPSALAWLDSLSRASNDIFPLRYADADVSLQAQAGVKTLLGPISFDHAIDLGGFTESTPEQSAGAGSPGEETTQPSPTPGPVTPPTTEELLAWDYTVADIAWPAEGSVGALDLAVFSDSGLTTTILAESQVTRPEKDLSGNAMVTVGAQAALVTDDAISGAIRRAAIAPTDDDWTAAMAEATSRLAVISAETPGDPRTVLATFGRGWPPTAERLSQTLDALATVPWRVPVTLAQVLGAGATSDATLEARVEPDGRVEAAQTLLQREGEITGFSSALADPVAVTAAHRLDLLALYATAWASDPDAWLEAVAASIEASSKVLKAVTVTTTGPINILATQVDIPVTLSNAFEQAVTVRVQLIPSNGRLVVGSEVEATIDAESARTVKVPVSAKVGNGDVTLRVSVYSPTGVLVSQPSVVDVNVQAEWEGLGSAVFAALVVAFFGFGVWRNIARRRKERATPPSSTTGTAVDINTGIQKNTAERAPAVRPSTASGTPPVPTTTGALLIAPASDTEAPRG